jgi:glycosyltransferase involved in cell wall biosynthesis
MSPLVSICIPSYNNAEYIEEAIRSVFDQDYDNLELIITDDASTDETKKIIERLIIDARIPVTFKIANENRGISQNWNYALSLAKGMYIKILPGDDIIESDCISKQVACFENNSDIALVFCGRKIITRSGRHLLTARFYKDRRVTGAEVLRKSVVNATNVVGEPGAVLFLREFSKLVGEFSPKRPYVVDMDYWMRLLGHGDAIAQYELLTSFRIDNNLSVRIGPSRKNQFTELCCDLSQKWNLSPTLLLYGKCRAAFNEFLRRFVHKLFFRLG